MNPEAAPPVAVTDIAYVRFEAPDLDTVADFYVDFGLRVAHRNERTLQMAAANGKVVHITTRADVARFVGVGFAVESVDEFGALEHLGFTAPDTADIAGVESIVRALDLDGFEVDVVAAQDKALDVVAPHLPERNRVGQSERQGSALSVSDGAAVVRRIGHCVLNVADYQRSVAWYRSRLGLVISDEIRVEDRPFGAFLRCDRGAIFVDHHTLFLVELGAASFNHAAFEVDGIDDLMAGHVHLQRRGRDAQWGIGRHILGSQIYDYWNDPNGFMVEHWTDGDLFNNENPARIATLDDLLTSQWGPMSGGPPP